MDRCRRLIVYASARRGGATLFIVPASGALPALLAVTRSLRRPRAVLAIWTVLLTFVSAGVLYLSWFEAGMNEAVDREIAAVDLAHPSGSQVGPARD